MLAELDRRKRTKRLADYNPYDKQKEFHRAGATYRERLLMAGNQLGKTLAGAAEVAMHLTGNYPDWWEGKRFDHPTTWLAGSESYELTRDGIQRLLLGPPDNQQEWGTGYIPQKAIVGHTSRSGVSNAIDTLTVRHKSGGASTVLFKAYEQGRKKWQANTVHGVWFDEEPPQEVYSEGITRTNATQGPVLLTFTPLLGMSDVVGRFLLEESQDRNVTTMTIDDVDHYTDEERRKIIDSYPEHEREARVKGIPSLGSGRIFPVAEEKITCDPFEIPRHWPQLGGIDFGYDHPFGAVRLAWNRDDDIIYVISEYRERQKTAPIHVAALRPWGDWLSFSWPHDGLQHDKASGEQLAVQYKNHGLKMLPERATFDDGTNGVEAGVLDMLERMQTGRWKVFRTCTSWLEEFRLYHRKDGKIVKERDDVIDASRYALMMKRFAKVKPKSVSQQFKPQAVA